MTEFIKASDPIPGLSGRTFADFWSWAYSDVLSNTNRSVFAEYLVACALDVAHNPRVEWHMYDLEYRGKRIEIKASAYLQSWRHDDKLSKIVFDIAPHRGWDAETNTAATDATRSADCYVFSIFTDRKKKDCRVTDPSRWLFYPVATQTINEKYPKQRTLGLASIERLRQSVNFPNLRTEIDRLLSVDPRISS